MEWLRGYYRSISSDYYSDWLIPRTVSSVGGGVEEKHESKRDFYFFSFRFNKNDMTWAVSLDTGAVWPECHLPQSWDWIVRALGSSTLCCWRDHYNTSNIAEWGLYNIANANIPGSSGLFWITEPSHASYSWKTNEVRLGIYWVLQGGGMVEELPFQNDSSADRLFWVK